MLAEFIRHLTHDNEQFDEQWSSTFDRINQCFIDAENNKKTFQDFKIKTLDALIDYVLAEPFQSIEPSMVKHIFIERVVKECAEDPSPSLTEIVRILHRILDLPDIYNEWYLHVIQTIQFKFMFCEHLTSTKSIGLIQSIFHSLQKHSFLEGQVGKDVEEKWQTYLSRRIFSPLSCDSNRLNHEELLPLMRPAFQQIFRHAVRLSPQSRVWAEVVPVFTRTLPHLFDNYDNPTDGQIDLVACVEPHISTDFVFFLAKSYHRNIDLLKTNFLHVLTLIERLLIMNSISNARYFFDEGVRPHMDTAVDIEALVQMLIRVCPLIDIDHRNEACKDVISSITYELGRKKFNKKLAPLCFEVGLVILEMHVVEAPKCVKYLYEKTEFYPWKDLASRFTDLVRLCAAYDTIEVTTTYSELDELSTILRLAAERGKATPIIFQATHHEALRAVLRWAGLEENSSKKIWSKHVYRMGEVMLKLIDQRQITANICAQFIEALKKKMSADDEDNDNQEEINSTMLSFFDYLAREVPTYIELLKTLPHEVHCSLASMLLIALSRPLRYENGNESLEQKIVSYIWFRFYLCLTNEADVRVYEPCLKKLHSLACDDGEVQFFSLWSTFWSTIIFKFPDVAADYVEDFFKDILDRKQTSLAGLLSTLYLKRPEPFHARLDDIINALCTDDLGLKVSLAQVFFVVAKEHPERITSTQVDCLFKLIENSTNPSNELYQIFQGLSFVANANPHLFDAHRATLLRFITEQQNVSAFKCLQQYFVALTIVDGEKKAEECVSILIDLLKKNTGINNDIRGSIFYALQLISVVNIKVVATKRADLLPFNSYAECRTLLDFIDGNKLNEENQASINQTRDVIADIEKRVIKTDTNLQNVTKVVKKQEIHMTNLSVRVNNTDTRLTDLNEQVQAQSREIERIDMKTLSYVPIEWGRDVCKLLNRRTDNDWRLLGKRFGYSASELRHWSMQADPSMALLNEWFMTHKADEATYGLVKMLGEIGRSDAVKIIQDAVTAAGQLIPDDIPFEIKRLPPVFLSYQWGSQKQVSTLKTHLEEAGYACWMDVGQMGGGDKLFAKIDAGIRGAKVIVCCMNSAYAQSDNCSREVHLTVSTGKPLIPLQMEKQTWPPEGALGPIMSEYLYIRFYDRKANSQDYWPTDKFTELLGQIRYHVAPNPDMISPRYHNWFVPRVDNLIFLQPTATDNQQTPTTLTNDIPIVVTHPQIMISYQWDRQKDILALYKRLTQLGYKCWLDIFQMGGGDSLFEKIDAGIRNAKCVLACVTPKYTISINCRREMSLADALKKPIIPLYLEETSTWPPSGPMSLVFTDKPYIDFRSSNTNGPEVDLWASKEFDKLLVRLKDVIPEVQIEKPRRQLLEMKRPRTASSSTDLNQRSARVKSAPVVPQSRACSLM